MWKDLNLAKVYTGESKNIICFWNYVSSLIFKEVLFLLLLLFCFVSFCFVLFCFVVCVMCVACVGWVCVYVCFSLIINIEEWGQFLIFWGKCFISNTSISMSRFHSKVWVRTYTLEDVMFQTALMFDCHVFLFQVDHQKCVNVVISKRHTPHL